MSAEREISQLRDRTAYSRVALQELALLRCKLVCDGIHSPGTCAATSLKLNEQTMAVIQHALEISTTRLETLEAERRFRTMGDLADCA
jgi:hypothetical protein